LAVAAGCETCGALGFTTDGVTFVGRPVAGCATRDPKGEDGGLATFDEPVTVGGCGTRDAVGVITAVGCVGVRGVAGTGRDTNPLLETAATGAAAVSPTRAGLRPPVDGATAAGLKSAVGPAFAGAD
jgi:hypothetical protein